ncbi:MAG: hydroxyacid dehydrogenase [Planctomycetota bacterium]|nr:hydroxyacid dehydrogenase [Planctomycetota bacterium]
MILRIRLTAADFRSIIVLMTDRVCRIVVAERLSNSALERLRAVGEVVELTSCDPDTLRGAVSDCHALVVRSYADVSAEIIKSAPALKVIARAGVGVENIDTKAAAGAGITVVHTPAASTEAVAELTIGLMITLERRVCWAHEQLRQGDFKRARNQLASAQLGEMTLGIIGFGRIGLRVAGMAQRAFGMSILFNDILPIPHEKDVARAVSKDEIYAESDVVSLHVPLTPTTRGLINAPTLRKMKSTALLINTARGAVVDATALASALDAGLIAGAAIDVFDPEPLPPDHALLSAPHCILTPHIGSRTASSLASMNDVVDDVIAVLQGREPRYPYRDDLTARPSP